MIAILTLMTCILGLIGNTIAFCTFGKMDSQNASTTLLRSLAIVDSSLLLVVIVSGFLSALHHDTWLLAVTVKCILWTSFFIARTCTIWTPVLVGLQRYVVVCKPLLVSRVCTVRNARVQFFCVCAFSVIVNFPQFFEHDIQELHSNHTDINLTFVTVQRTMSQSLWYKTIYKEVLLVWLINYIIPVSSLVYITVKLLQSLRFSRQRRIAMTQGQGQSASHDNRRVNMMVIVVIIVFVICHSVFPVIVILGSRFIFYEACLGVLMILPLLNSSVNCLIYIIFNRKFRQILCPC